MLAENIQILRKNQMPNYPIIHQKGKAISESRSLLGKAKTFIVFRVTPSRLSGLFGLFGREIRLDR
jgi:hypothetical protein